MAKPKLRMRSQKNPLLPSTALSTDATQLMRYVRSGRSNPFAYLCRVIAGTPIICSQIDDKTGEVRDIKVRATIAQRIEAARILAAKLVPDLKALEVTGQQVTIDLARLTTAQLYAYLQAATGTPNIVSTVNNEIIGSSDSTVNNEIIDSSDSSEYHAISPPLPGVVPASPGSVDRPDPVPNQHRTSTRTRFYSKTSAGLVSSSAPDPDQPPDR